MLLDLEPSKFIQQSFAKVVIETGSSVLDLACGSGRHAVMCANTGHRVTAVDIDPKRLRDVGNAATSLSDGAISRVRADAAAPLPFHARSFDLIVIVHFIAPGLIANVTPLLRPGGYLLLETFGGHGENWRSLPFSGQYRHELNETFDVLDYRETAVGPTKREAVTVRVMARRR